MSKEATIRKQAVKQLEKEGYITWCPAKVKYQETDVFGVFDCLALKDSDIRFIQWTSSSNVAARKKKILKFYEDNDVFLPAEVWGYRSKPDKNGKKWRIVYI